MKFIKATSKNRIGKINPEYHFNTFQEFLNIPFINNAINDMITQFKLFSLSIDLETGKYLLSIIDIKGNRRRYYII